MDRNRYSGAMYWVTTVNTTIAQAKHNVLTYLSKGSLLLLKKNFFFFCNFLYLQTLSFGFISLISQTLHLEK